MGFDAMIGFTSIFTKKWGDRGGWVTQSIPKLDEKLMDEWAMIKGNVWYSLLCDIDGIYEYDNGWNVAKLHEFLTEEIEKMEEQGAIDFWDKLDNSEKINYIQCWMEKPKDMEVTEDIEEFLTEFNCEALNDLERMLKKLNAFLHYLVEIEKKEEENGNFITFKYYFSY